MRSKSTRTAPQIRECPNEYTPCRTRKSGDTPTDALHRVGNTFMCSETCPFAPEPGAFCRPSLPGRAWPGPYRARRNYCGAADMGRPVLAEHINMFPTGLLPPSGCIQQTGPVCTCNSGNASTNAPHRVGAAAMPGPCRTGNSGCAPTGAHAV